MPFASTRNFSLWPPHYRFEPRVASPYRGNEKGRVERAIRFIRDRFFAARSYRDLDDLNKQAHEWTHGIAADRIWPDDRKRKVRDAFAEEKTRLMALPEDSFVIEERREVSVGKSPYVRFEETIIRFHQDTSVEL